MSAVSVDANSKGLFRTHVKAASNCHPNTMGWLRCCLLFSFLGWSYSVSLAQDVVVAEVAPDFKSAVEPFVSKYCADCHLNGTAEAGVDLSKFNDSAVILRERLMWERVVEVLSNGTMPPKEQSERPSGEEVQQIVKSLQGYYEYSDRHVKPDPGRITMRRLNRVEYRNTVRDLFGIDFDPTEEFPSDDIGHGFDNIGDVLSLSPVLMERYLKAAESIATRAIVDKAPPVNRRHLQSRFTEPAAKDLPMDGSFRVLRSNGNGGLETGPIFTSYMWEDEGVYEFRSRLFAKAPEGQEVEVAVLVQGDGLKDVDSDEALAVLAGEVKKPAKILYRGVVKARTAENSEVIEVPLPALSGRERLMVGLIKPKEGAAPAELYVEYLSLKGPMDSRPLSHKQWLAHPAELQGIERNRHIVQRWLRKLYRRPPTPEEVEKLATLATAEEAAGAPWESAMQMALQAALCSPKFLFRVELDNTPDSSEVRPIDQFALASRLSYFLWSTMPDDRLMDLAERSELSEKLQEEVLRMLNDPRASSLVDQFVLQWLQLQRLEQVQPDKDMFPEFGSELRRAMMEETRLMFLHIIKEDRSILELIDAPYTFLNERLAKFYGIEDTRGNLRGSDAAEKGEPIKGKEFRLVQLPANSPRGGVLTQASVLTVTSNPTRTSPVKRGRWVLEQLLGAPPPPPPPNVPELPADPQAQVSGSLRQRLEMHRANPSCANCHAKMDPLGFALENYDAVGRFRTKDGNFDIDAGGELPDGSKFANLTELKGILRKRSRDVTRCLTEKMLIFALGRGLEYYDRPAVKKIVETVESQDHRFSALVMAIVSSDAFRLRRQAE